MSQWQPATGTMKYTNAEGCEFNLNIKEAGFSVYKKIYAEPENSTGLLIEVMTEPVTHEWPPGSGDEWRVAPSLGTEWLSIRDEDLKSRGRDALKEYHMRFADDPEDFSEERPANVYDDCYGGVVDMELALTWNADGSYRLNSKGLDEFQRRFEIDANLGLFKVIVRHYDSTKNPAVEAWLKERFDTSDMNVSWERKGAGDGWYELHATYE